METRRQRDVYPYDQGSGLPRTMCQPRVILVKQKKTRTHVGRPTPFVVESKDPGIYPTLSTTTIPFWMTQ